MDSSKLTREQAEQLRETIRPYVWHLHRVLRRMEKVGFPLNDPLYLKYDAAYTAARNLSMELHYRSCKGGVGRRPGTDE